LSNHKVEGERKQRLITGEILIYVVVVVVARLLMGRYEVRDKNNTTREAIEGRERLCWGCGWSLRRRRRKR
jgi:hypothetical protein